MNYQPLPSKPNKIQGKPLLFALSLTALVLYSLYAIFYFVAFFDYLSSASVDILIYLLPDLLGSALIFTSILLLFLIAVTLHKSAAAQKAFSLIFLFLFISSTVGFIFSLLTPFFGGRYADSVSSFVWLFYDFAAMILALFAMLNGFRVFKGIVPIVIAMACFIPDKAYNIWEWITVLPELNDLALVSLAASLGVLLFYITVILYVALNGIPGSSKKIQ